MNINELRNLIYSKTIEEQFTILTRMFPGKVIFTTSLGIEDQVLTDIIFKNNFDIEVVTLDTGRLFAETYKVFSETIIKYNKNIHAYFPDYLAVEKMVTEKGPFSFYESKGNRIECCRIRKVIPLTRALLGKKCWISGIRATQSDDRSNMEQLEYDKNRKLYKFYPLFDWSFDEVKKFIKEHNIPYNVMHDRGFVSIGCEPCTRAIKPDEDFRSGRWWWENDGPKECGCHIK